MNTTQLRTKVAVGRAPPKVKVRGMMGRNGMGNTSTVQVLLDLVHQRKLVLLFLMETMSKNNKMQAIKRKLGWHRCFTVDPLGRGGGLALLLKDNISVTV